jgi:hypothetical protein
MKPLPGRYWLSFPQHLLSELARASHVKQMIKTGTLVLRWDTYLPITSPADSAQEKSPTRLDLSIAGCCLTAVPNAANHDDHNGAKAVP